MNKEEYIIINKSVLKQRIENLEKESVSFIPAHEATICYKKLDELKQILSQSTPLIPEIEKQSIEFTKNLLNCTVSEAKSIDNIKEYHPKEYQLLLGELELNGKKIFEDYISNLKLEI